MTKPKTLISSLFFIISYVTLLSSTSAANNATGFTTDLIHRDAPDSPLRDPSATPWQRVAAARQRALTRAGHIANRFFNVKEAESVVSPETGTYLMRYYIGIPRITAVGIVDTGSDLVWTQCYPCVKCTRQLYPTFNPRNSDSYKRLPCSSPRCAGFSRSSRCDDTGRNCIYSTLYGDGSHSYGDVATETFGFDSSKGGTTQASNIVFGCGHDNSFHFPGTVASGIVGLSGAKSSLVRQLGYDRFSHCLMPHANVDKASKMHFGRDAEVSGPGVVSTPLSGFHLPVNYFVTLEAISVGSKRLEFPSLFEGGNMVIDSGTLVTTLPVNFYDKLESAIANSISRWAVRDFGDWRLCYAGPFVMPKIMVHFKGGADVEWRWENAFIRVNRDYVCLAVLPMESLPIYGNVALANYLVGYDLNDLKVSFKPTPC